VKVNFLQSNSVLLLLAILHATLNDTNTGFDVAMYQLLFLIMFVSAYKTDFVVYGKFRCVFQQIQNEMFQDVSLIYSYSYCPQPKFSVLSKYYGPSSPSTPTQTFFTVFSAVRLLTCHFSTWNSLNVFTRSCIIISTFSLVTTQTFIHRCKGHQ